MRPWVAGAGRSAAGGAAGGFTGGGEQEGKELALGLRARLCQTGRSPRHGAWPGLSGGERVSAGRWQQQGCVLGYLGSRPYRLLASQYKRVPPLCHLTASAPPSQSAASAKARTGLF